MLQWLLYLRRNSKNRCAVLTEESFLATLWYEPEGWENVPDYFVLVTVKTTTLKLSVEKILLLYNIELPVFNLRKHDGDFWTPMKYIENVFKFMLFYLTPHPCRKMSSPVNFRMQVISQFSAMCKVLVNFIDSMWVRWFSVIWSA